MSRRRKAQIRDVLPDPVHNSTVLTKFTNAIMLDGKKAVAESLINRSFTDIQSKTGESPISIFTKAIDNELSIFIAIYFLSTIVADQMASAILI